MKASLLSLALSMTLMGLTSAAAAADGQVFSVMGTVTVQRGGQTLVLKPGDAVNSKDIVTTGPRSLVRLRMSDEGFFALPANSTLKIEDYVLPRDPNAENARSFFSLLKGGFRTVTGLVGKIRHDSYKMVTPVATLGVRGTEFMAKFTPPVTNKAGEVVKEGDLAMTVISGTVVVTTLVDGVETTTEVQEGESLTLAVGTDANGNQVATGAPVVSEETPAAFTSGGDGEDGSDGSSLGNLFNPENAIDAPGPGELVGLGIPGPSGEGGSGFGDFPAAPGLPGTTRNEPLLPQSDDKDKDEEDDDQDPPASPS